MLFRTKKDCVHKFGEGVEERLRIQSFAIVVCATPRK